MEQQSVLRRIVSEEIGRPNFLSQVPWGDLIENASEIDFIVQGWDGWADQQNTSRALASFFERGGHFSLYVYNADSDEASQARALMAQRLGRAPGEVVTEINGTFRRINETREHVPAGKIDTSKLELIQTNNLNWYFAAFFKGRELAGQARARDVMVFSIWQVVAARAWPDVDGGIAITVQFIFKSGAVGNLLATSYAPHFTLSATVISDAGYVASMNGLHDVQVHDRHAMGKRWGSTWRPRTLGTGFRFAGYQTELERFFIAIANKTPATVHPSFKEEVAIYEAMDSIEKSIEGS